MIPAPILKWANGLTNDDLRVGYVEALEWLYESADDLADLPLTRMGLTELDWWDEPDGPDDFARAFLLECAGRWVYDQDSAA